MTTALLNVTGARGNIMQCRAILVSASQLHFVSDRLVKHLGLEKIKIFKVGLL